MFWKKYGTKPFDFHNLWLWPTTITLTYITTFLMMICFTQEYIFSRKNIENEFLPEITPTFVDLARLNYLSAILCIFIHSKFCFLHFLWNSEDFSSWKIFVLDPFFVQFKNHFNSWLFRFYFKGFLLTPSFLPRQELQLWRVF